MDRRQFIKTTSASALSISALPVGLAPRTPVYKTALIGSGWWGMNILMTALEAGQSKVVSLCDVDHKHLDEASAKIREVTNDTFTTHTDYRELLRAEKPDIVIVATPDHWHPLNTIAAIEAGAHVYVEKPVGHTVNEGRAMVQAARKHGKIVQVGTHRRVSPHNVSGMKFLKSGKAGTIGSVRAFVHYGGNAGVVTPDSEVPEGLDWDMWCGPGSSKAVHTNAFIPRGFRQFLDYANGQIGDWGIHWLDQILWWTEEKYPRHVYSTGGRFVRADNTDAPDTQFATFEFESFTATWEHRFYAHNHAEKANIGCYFYGTEGTFHMGWRDGWTFYPRDAKQPIIHQEPQLNAPDDQNIRELWANFLSAIETNTLPVCDIEIGHRSTNMSLLAMLSLKLGRSIEWDGEREIIPEDEEANALLERPYRAPCGLSDRYLIAFALPIQNQLRTSDFFSSRKLYP